MGTSIQKLHFRFLSLVFTLTVLVLVGVVRPAFADDSSGTDDSGGPDDTDYAQSMQVKILT